MKSILGAIFTVILLGAISLAQDTTPPPSSSPQQSPAAQAPSSAQPSAAGSQQTPQTTPSDTAQPSTPSRQAPAEEQTGQPNASGGQQPNSGRPAKNGQEGQGVKRLAPGSVIPVQLAKSIDAKKVKSGDEVVAKVTQDMKSNNGEVILTKDTKVLGHVTEAQPRSKEQKESQIGIAFDRVVTKNSEMQMPMSIQAIIGPQNNNPNGGAGQPPEETSANKAPSGTGRASGMGGSTPPPTPSASTGAGDQPSDAQSSTARAPITAQTQGVVGMKDLKLESAGQAPTQGSVVSSDKNNVKLDSGTMMLLRVNQ